MFRITRTYFAHRSLIVVEGCLAGASIKAIKTTCDEAQSSKLPVTIFLKNITEIDDSGYKLLRYLSRTKTRLRALGIYTRYLVKKLESTEDMPDLH
jgi:hypothetical protein